MSERRDYIALEWVAGEIEETLRLAAQALEEYSQNRNDITKLRFCLTHIHQVQGTLKMVEFFGAALLAEEMEGVANALTQGKIHESHTDDALSVLKYSIIQLPLYLERVKESRHGLPATLLPVLNDLRAVRGESLLSETVLFSPDLSNTQEFLANDGVKVAIDGDELEAITHKLRQMFQIALLGLIRNQELKKNLNYLAKVCSRLVKLSDGAVSQPLWRVCIAVLEGLLNGSIDPSISVKILLRQVDREIKQIVEQGETALLKEPPEGLFKNLLYYVARSKASSKYISEVKRQYKLNTSLPGEGELSDESLAIPDSAIMHSVIEALGQELGDIKTTFFDAGNDRAALSRVLPLFRRVCDTMAVLGMGSTLKLIQEPFAHLRKMLATQGTIDSKELDSLAQLIEHATKALNPTEIMEKQPQVKSPFNDSEEAQQHLDAAFDSIIRESRKNLESAKEAIIEFVATQWDHNSLSDMPELLNSIYGSLKMAPLPTAANIIHSCNMFVSKELLGNRTVPAWQMLDTLADAITSIDYYLERLADDAESESDAILEVAAESVAELGYPIELIQDQTVQANDSHIEDSVSPSEVTELVETVTLLDNKTDSEIQQVDQPESNLNVDESASDEFVSDEAILDETTISKTTIDEAINDEAVIEEKEEDEVDPEIIEIFVEEAGEVLEAINESLPQWKLNHSDNDSRSTVRRAFHTIKGSGRMVAATDIGDLAWSIENMLNRINDGSIDVDQIRFDLIDKVIGEVPSLVSAFEKRMKIDRNVIDHLIACADALAMEQDPTISLDFTTDEETVDEDTLASQIDGGSIVDSAEIELDAELMEIFAAETITHGHVLENFIGHCQQLAGPAVLTDELQRALHTLKGSANMAGIIPVAEIVTPIEHLVKELRASQLKTNEDVVDLLGQCLVYIQSGIAQLTSTPLRSLPGADEFIEQVEECELRMISAAVEGVTESGIPPEALNQFLSDSLDRITEVTENLARWKKDGSDSVDLSRFDSTISDFVDHAASINLLSPAEFGQALEVLYRRGTQASSVDSAYFELAEAGNDALIDMLDQIAGHQHPVFDSALLDKILNFEFQSSVVSLSDYMDIAETEIESGLDSEAEASLTDVSGLDPSSFDEFSINKPGNEELVREELENDEFDSEELGSGEPETQGIEAEQTSNDETDVEEFMAEFIDAISVDFDEEIVEEDGSALAVEENKAADLPEIDRVEFNSIEAGSISDESVVADVTEEALDEYEQEDDAFDFGAVLEGDSDSEPDAQVEENVETNIDIDSDNAEELSSEITEEAATDYVDAISGFSDSDLGLDDEDDFASLLETSIENNPLSEDLAKDLDGSSSDLVENLVHSEIDKDKEVESLMDSSSTAPSEPTGVNRDGEDSDVDDEIVEIFLEEAHELLEDIDDAIHKWEQDRIGGGPLKDLLRILHTIKGGARVAGLTGIGDLSHDFESTLIKADNENIEITDGFIADIQHYQDSLISLISSVKSGGIAIIEESEGDEGSSATEEQLSIEASGSVDVEKIGDIDAGESSFDEQLTGEIANNEVENDKVAVIQGVETEEHLAEERGLEEEEKISVLQFKKLDRQAEIEKPVPVNRLQETVKVPAQLLEELVNLAGETSISRGRAEEQISELVFSLDEMQITVDRLQEQVRRLDMETEQQILYRQEQVESEGLEGFDPLEMDRYSQLQQLSRSLLESSSDLIDIKSTLSDKSKDMETLLIQQSRINTDLQEGLLRSRMVPFQRMIPRLRRIVRQISNELGKNVLLRSDNIEGELDRAVLERMVAPLEHMIRNAVDHGIESAEQRLAAGKPDMGTITLNLLREGGEIVLQLSDDGAGIDFDAVKRKAIERGLMDADAKLSEREILQFIMQSGFSTAASVTQISGRGVGMDVVHSEIKQLGGSMEIESTLKIGTLFTIRLPFTVSVNRALMVSVSGDNYAIPLNTIEGIVRVSPYELEAYYQPDAPLFEYAGQPYHLRYMGSLLQRGEKPNLEGQSMPLPVLLVRGVEHSVAIQVDSLMGSREIVVKPLGPQFNMVQGLSGATVLGDGSVVVILDLMAMIRADVSHLHRDRKHGGREDFDDEKNVLVMVVDDSVTVRKVMSRFLERQGMDVLLAHDGVDAVTQLTEIDHIPDLMLLDIEMPRMDGFEVANRVRHNSRLKDIPIIMITSRTGEKHRDRAMSLGVNEYIGKPYQETELLEKIIALTGVEIEQ